MGKLAILFITCIFVASFLDGADSFFRRRRRRRRRTPPPDTKPPVISKCPEDLGTHPSTTPTTTDITWIEPTAYDEYQKGHVNVQRYGKGPGSVFREGDHDITYTARDNAGNQAKCLVHVTVYVVRCSALLHPHNGYIICSDGVYVGSACRYYCIAGYALSKEVLRECQDNGTWSGEEGSCEVILCHETIEAPPNGGVSCTNGNYQQSVCTYSCEAGYAIPPSQSRDRVCTATGWTGTKPSCEVLECPAVDAPENGDYVGGQPCQRTYGSSCYFMCNAGYFINNNVLRCEAQPGSEEALWVGTPPVCTVETCEVPALDDGMYYVINTTCADQSEVELGEECGFECGYGYNLYGSEILTCGINGEWQQQAPLCEIVTCISSDIPTPFHGIKSGCPNEYENYGTVCRFTCDVGYLPSESVHRTCLDDGDGNGVWSGGPVSCTVVQCDPLEVPTNGYIESCRLDGEQTESSGKQDYGTTCNVLCNLGYTAQSATSRRCLANGEWDGIDQSCIDVTSPILHCPYDRVIFALAGQSKAELHWEDWEPVKGTGALVLNLLLQILPAFSSDR